MSRSNNTEIQNPATKYLEWKGGDGVLRYYDKEKKENVTVKLPFTFLVLDRLSTIKGFSDADQSGFWSNEIRNIKTDPLTVRTKKGIVASGLYSTLAPVLNLGACYCQSVYVAAKGDSGKLEIMNIQLYGSAIGPWIELLKGKDIYKFAVTISGSTPAKKGKTEYHIPNFKLSQNISETTEQRAQDLDRVLQEYLTAYFKRSQAVHTEAVTDTVASRSANEEPMVNNGHAPEDDFADVNATTAEMETPVDDLPF